MPELTYTELEIRLRPRQGNAYPIEAELDTGERFADEFDLDPAELAALESQPEAYGKKLFKALFSGEIRDAYRDALKTAKDKTEGHLRVRLCLDDQAPELHALNWERLYHQRGGGPTPLATDDASLLSRYTSLSTPEPEPLTEQPARLLIAIANPDKLAGYNLAPVPVADELHTLLEALTGQPVRVTVLPGRTPLPADLTAAMHAAGWEVRAGPTTLAALAEAAIDQHILHFVGHGVFVAKTRETKLFLEQDALVSDAKLVEALSGRRSLRLVFLMACETATRPEEGDTSFVGLGPRLVQNDVPVVVGMQRPFPIRASAPFTRVFYHKLFELGVVDRAVSQARQAIFAHDALAWSTPVLFMRLRSGRIFADHEAPPPPDTKWRTAYLRTVLAGDYRLLPLQALDTRLRATGVAVQMSEVYVPLLTLTPAEHAEWARGEREMARTDDRRLSALEQLDKHQHLLLLGDPGFGKSTFVNLLTLCLAGQALGDPTLNERLLTASVPQNDKKKAKPQAWRHGALLPVRVVLRHFAETLPASGTSADLLWQFVEMQLREKVQADCAPALRDHLQTTGGLILLDGLDEVPQANARRAQLIAIVHKFAQAFPKCRLLVTARVYAYQAQDWRLDNFAVATLAPFTVPQMAAFAEQWYTRLNALHSLNAPPGDLAAELMRNIRERRQLFVLAEQPLLLTFMAGLRIFSPLPDRRQELYEKIVELLFNEWEQGKLRGTDNLASLLKVSPDELRTKVVERLAYEAHAHQPAGDGQRTADLAEDQLIGGLYRLVKDRADQPNLEQLKAHIKDRAGLLIEHGAERYTFPHRTFQEYLAACHITREHSQSHLAGLVRADVDRWREVALLAAARWYSGGRDSLWNLARKLCPNPLPATAPAAAAWAAALAGQALVEAGTTTPNDDDEAATLTTLTASLAAGVLGHPNLPAVERARAGRVLSGLGDPRPGVGVVREPVPLEVSATPRIVRLWGDKPEHVGLPDITWVQVPGVTGFRLETDEGDKGVYDIPPFYIAQYPVTGAQFQAFVAADDGFANPRWWAGLAARAEHRRAPRPAQWPYANHPRDGVSWWDAVAFGRWLSARLGWPELPADLNQTGLRTFTGVRLPTEWEWQWAACPRQPQTAYPWEGDITPDHANYDETQIGQPSAVGVFPSGATLDGVHDMSGNVWEWCLNEYQQPGNIALGGEQSRVMRGGAWGNLSVDARAVNRFWGGPSFLNYDMGFRVVRAPVGLGF